MSDINWDLRLIKRVERRSIHGKPYRPYIVYTHPTQGVAFQLRKTCEEHVLRDQKANDEECARNRKYEQFQADCLYSGICQSYISDRESHLYWKEVEEGKRPHPFGLNVEKSLTSCTTVTFED